MLLISITFWMNYVIVPQLLMGGFATKNLVILQRKIIKTLVCYVIDILCMQNLAMCAQYVYIYCYRIALTQDLPYD